MVWLIWVWCDVGGLVVGVCDCRIGFVCLFCFVVVYDWWGIFFGGGFYDCLGFVCWVCCVLDCVYF